MRELRVIGLEPDSKHVVLADDSGEKYRLVVDETLRAASRGDLARLGQIQIESTSTLRPREIQARIRGGASVAQVAQEAGVPESKVERFAYPVLLERSRAAEMAQQGHPVLEDGPAVQTLSEIVTQEFRVRGHAVDTARWDAWRDDEGQWVVQLEWTAGRSTNAAHWRFQPDAHGGTITALDEIGHELIDPEVGRSLRSLTPPPHDSGTPELDTADAPVDETVIVDAEVETDDGFVYYTDDAADERPTPEHRRAPQQAPHRDKRGKPALPSWDDVLLGVRSSGRG